MLSNLYLCCWTPECNDPTLKTPRQTRHRQGYGIPTLLFQLNHNETALQRATCATLLFTLLCYKAIRLICDNTVKSEWQTPASIVQVIDSHKQFPNRTRSLSCLKLLCEIKLCSLTCEVPQYHGVQPGLLQIFLLQQRDTGLIQVSQIKG